MQLGKAVIVELLMELMLWNFKNVEEHVIMQRLQVKDPSAMVTVNPLISLKVPNVLPAVVQDIVGGVLLLKQVQFAIPEDIIVTEQLLKQAVNVFLAVMLIPVLAILTVMVLNV